MKAAVITNCDKTNYGSILQAFALQQEIKDLGGSGFVLQKRSVKKKSLAKKIKNLIVPSGNGYSIKSKWEIKRARKLYTTKNKKLAAFCQKQIEIKTCSTKEAEEILLGDVDTLIAGSDQIWSPRAGLLSYFTTLQFGGKWMKRYAYAASVGVSDLSPEEKSMLRNGLREFQTVSLRESSSIKLIAPLCKCEMRTDVDPTFLYDASFWEQYANTAPMEKNYIFVYMLRPEPLTLKLAKALSEKTGFPIYLISNRIISDDSIHNVTDAGIEDFLSYIKNAAYVVTNSFHGTAFSVQFHRPFLSVAIEGSGMRVSDFLNDVGLKDHIASEVTDFEKITQDTDWAAVDALLAEKRKNSTEYLRSILQAEPCIEHEKEMVLFRSKEECCGCGACSNACPKDAITMEADNCGFFYPFIHKENCIQCGKCKKVCAYQHKHMECENQCVKAVVAKEETMRKKSASGGAFAGIAQKFLEAGGVVYGCAMQDTTKGLSPMHIRIDQVEDLGRLQSSKYAHSYLGDTYCKVEEDLKAGRKVLFSGTGCQAGALRGFLNGKQYDNLFIIDLICHGVPSTAILQGYQRMVERKKHIRIREMNFRDKRYGWGEKGTITGCDCKGKEKKIYFDNYNSSFYNLYLKAGFYRANCYTCRYANLDRAGDITVGDFWGIGQRHPKYLEEAGGNWKVEQGISCLLVNTQQGKKLLKQYGDALDVQESSMEDVTFKNKMLLRPSAYNPQRTKILELYQNGGYGAVDKWFWKKYWKRQLIYGMWDKIPVRYREKIKGIKKFRKF